MWIKEFENIENEYILFYENLNDVDLKIQNIKLIKGKFLKRSLSRKLKINEVSLNQHKYKHIYEKCELILEDN